MPRPYSIHWDQVLRYLPPSLPMLYRVEADGLPAPDSLVQAGTGAEGKAIRQFQAHLLHAMIHRIHDLEGSLAACESDKGAMDKALSSTPAPQVPVASPAVKEAMAIEDAALQEMLAAKERLPQLEADLKKANTKANVYYTSWKSLERHVNHKAKVVPSDEMNLAAAVTALVERGYIQDIQPNGNIPVGIMCQMVAGIAEKLPPTEAISFNAGDHVLEPVLAVGDPYPTEFRLHANANGVVHTYFRAGKDTPVGFKAVAEADVTGYAELEQINTTLESQLRQAQRDLAEAACWMDTAQQHAKNEEFYRDLLDQTAMALNDPEVYKSDDGSIQQEPIRLKVPELVAKLVQNQGSEAGALLAHNIVLLDKFRSGVRAITDPMEGQDEKLLEMLHRMKTRALYTGNGTHLQAQSMEMRNGVLYRITGLYYDGHDFEPVDFVNTLQADAQPEEPKAEAQPNVIDMVFQGLLDRIMATEQQAPLEDCHTLTAGPLHLRAEFFDGVVVERRWDGFDFAVLTIPQAITPKQELGNHMAGSEYMVETNTLYLLAAWKGEHPSNWKLDAKFDLRPQIINRER